MIFLSFGNRAFNKEYTESNIYMIVSPKGKYSDPLDFLTDAVAFVDEKVYPGEDFKADYEGMYLRDGDYGAIVEQWSESMDQSIELSFDDIIDIKRIKCISYDPLRDEFLIETKEEHVMFLWFTTA